MRKDILMWVRGRWNEKGHSEVDMRSVECARRV